MRRLLLLPAPPHACLLLHQLHQRRCTARMRERKAAGAEAHAGSCIRAMNIYTHTLCQPVSLAVPLSLVSVLIPHSLLSFSCCHCCRCSSSCASSALLLPSTLTAAVGAGDTRSCSRGTREAQAEEDDRETLSLSTASRTRFSNSNDDSSSLRDSCCHSLSPTHSSRYPPHLVTHSTRISHPQSEPLMPSLTGQAEDTGDATPHACLLLHQLHQRRCTTATAAATTVPVRHQLSPSAVDVDGGSSSCSRGIGRGGRQRDCFSESLSLSLDCLQNSRQHRQTHVRWQEARGKRWGRTQVDLDNGIRNGVGL